MAKIIDFDGKSKKILKRDQLVPPASFPDKRVRDKKIDNGDGSPEIVKKIEVLKTVDNLIHLLNMYGYCVRYNVVTKEDETTGLKNMDSDNAKNVFITEVDRLCTINNMHLGRGDIRDFILSIASKNEYNPAFDWVNSRPWDGVNRLDDFCSTIRVSTKD